MITPKESASSESVARHYDELDPIYRAIWGEHIHHGLWRTGRETPEEAALEMVHTVARKLGAKPGMKICDVGCGYGATARILAQEYGCEVDAITISPAQHEYAIHPLPEGRFAFGYCDQDLKGHLGLASIPHRPSLTTPPPNPRYHLGDWLTNDFPDAHFDGLIAIESTEHMPDLNQCFQQIARVLKPGGRVVICTWSTSDNPTAWQKRHLLEPICREGRLFGMGTLSDYRTAAACTSLSAIAADNMSKQVARTWTVCILRALRNLLTNTALRRYLICKANQNRIFALTVLRIRMAYALEAMRYEMITLQQHRVI